MGGTRDLYEGSCPKECPSHRTGEGRGWVYFVSSFLNSGTLPGIFFSQSDHMEL